MPAAPASIGELFDLRSMIGHQKRVQAHEILEAVHMHFARHEFEFIPVLEGRNLLGLCSRRQIGTVLGARYGFAIHPRNPVRERLLKEMTDVRVHQPTSEALASVFSPSNTTLFDDVILADKAGVLHAFECCG